MAGNQQQDMARQVVDRFKARATQYAQGMAQRMGAPASATKLSNEEIVRLWNFSPHPHPPTAYAQALAAGQPPGQALDQVHPYRRKLFMAPTVTEQVAKAESIKALVDSHAGQASTP